MKNKIKEAIKTDEGRKITIRADAADCKKIDWLKTQSEDPKTTTTDILLKGLKLLYECTKNEKEQGQYQTICLAEQQLADTKKIQEIYENEILRLKETKRSYESQIENLMNQNGTLIEILNRLTAPSNDSTQQEKQ